MSGDLKRAVAEFWNAESCGEVYATGTSELDRYETQARSRYALEPYLPAFARFEDGKGRDVLEIGVGMGADHLEWAKAGPRRLCGLDLTPRALEHTAARLRAYGLTSSLLHGDAEKLPYADQSFDLVYSWGVLHHTPDTEAALREVYRVLRPGGTARVMLYHRSSVVGYLLWLRHALLSGKPATSLDVVYAEHLESPGTKAYSVVEARKMFAQFGDVDVRVQLSFGDLLQGEIGSKQEEKAVLGVVKTLWPRPLIRRLLPNRGLDLLIEARRSPVALRLGIDSSNLKSGGGITHLVGLLTAAEPGQSGFERVTVWGSRDILRRLPERDWLRLIPEPALEGGLLQRLRWQRFRLEGRAAAACDVLLVPGGSYLGGFRPFVTISRNLLPFEPREMRRYFLSRTFLRLGLLHSSQASTFRRADGLIFLTKYAESSVSKAVGERRGMAALIPHGVDRRFFLPPRPQRALSEYSQRTPFRLLYVSIVDVYKHQWAVAAAVARLHAEGLPILLDLVGDAYPPALLRLERTLRDLDPEQRFIRRRGPVPHSELHVLYQSADAFVFASSCENMPNILLEAMAAGLPIACSSRGPMPEILGAAGNYFDPEDVDSVTRSVRTLVSDAGQRERWATEAYQRALAFSWQRCARETLDFVAEVGRGSRPGDVQTSVALPPRVRV